MSSPDPPEEEGRQEQGQGGRKTKKMHRSVSGGRAAADGRCWPCGQEKLPELKVEYDSTDEEEYASKCTACRALPSGTLCNTHKSKHTQNTASRRFRARNGAYITDLVRQNKAQMQGITHLVTTQQNFGLPLPEWASTYLPKTEHNHPSPYDTSVAPASAITDTSNAVAQQVAQSDYSAYSAYGYRDHRQQDSYRAPTEQQTYPPLVSTVSQGLNQTNNFRANMGQPCVIQTPLVQSTLQNGYNFTASSSEQYYDTVLDYCFWQNGTTESRDVRPPMDTATSWNEQTHNIRNDGENAGRTDVSGCFQRLPRKRQNAFASAGVDQNRHSLISAIPAQENADPTSGTCQAPDKKRRKLVNALMDTNRRGFISSGQQQRRVAEAARLQYRMAAYTAPPRQLADLRMRTRVIHELPTGQYTMGGICQRCCITYDTSEHLLLQCPAFHRQRLDVLGANPTMSILETNPHAVMAFLQVIGLVSRQMPSERSSPNQRPPFF